MGSTRSRPRWGITAVAALAGLVAIAASFALHGAGEVGLRAAIRATARIAVVLFSVTFASSALNALSRSPASKWLLRHRRQLGLGFAAVQFAHLGLVLTLVARHPESFWATTSLVSVIGDGVGYVWTAAMSVTSFDRTTAWLGRRAWTALHKSGMYVLWGIFVFSYVGRAGAQPLYAILFGLLALSYVLRLCAVCPVMVIAPKRTAGPRCTVMVMSTSRCRGRVSTCGSIKARPWPRSRTSVRSRSTSSARSLWLNVAPLRCFIPARMAASGLGSPPAKAMRPTVNTSPSSTVKVAVSVRPSAESARAARTRPSAWP